MNKNSSKDSTEHPEDSNVTWDLPDLKVTKKRIKKIFFNKDLFQDWEKWYNLWWKP
jgi:hypothetical protein